MSKDEIKYEINKVLDSMPDKALEDLLSFLKTIESRTTSSTTSKNDFLERILAEDRELLEKLAK
jgi:hypothetical protein